jgi:hypothetical protein
MTGDSPCITAAGQEMELADQQFCATRIMCPCCTKVFCHQPVKSSSANATQYLEIYASARLKVTLNYSEPDHCTVLSNSIIVLSRMLIFGAATRFAG